MNSSDIEYRLKRLKEEDLIWLVYFFIVTFAIISNYYERQYVINNNKVAKKKFKNINTTIFIVAFFIYLYYFITADIDLNKSTRKSYYDNYLRYFGALLFFVAGAIYLYVDYHSNIEEVNVGII